MLSAEFFDDPAAFLATCAALGYQPVAQMANHTLAESALMQVGTPPSRR